MNTTVVGLFPDLHHADQAVEDLVAAGVVREAISVMANDAAGDYAAKVVRHEDSHPVAVGAGTGAAVGGTAGLILGLAAFAIPGIGPVVASGPLLAALGGILVGAATGGLVGALVDMGIPEEEAHIYAEGVRRGGTVVTAHVDPSLKERAVEIMQIRGAADIHDSAAAWQRDGWTGYRRAA